jgi:hypothetical protein
MSTRTNDSGSQPWSSAILVRALSPFLHVFPWSTEECCCWTRACQVAADSLDTKTIVDGVLPTLDAELPIRKFEGELIATLFFLVSLLDCSSKALLPHPVVNGEICTAQPM